MKYRVEWFLVWVIQQFLLVHPRLLVRPTGRLIGLIFWILRIRYAVARQNLQRAFPDWPRRKIGQTLRANYRSLGITFAELLVLSKLPVEQRVTIPFDLTGGAILLSGHMGNWEWLAKCLASVGVKLAVVVRAQRNPHVDRLINRERGRVGLTVVYENEVWKMKRLVEQGYAIGLLADQDAGHNDRWIRFFGQICAAPSGPEFFARMRKPVYFAAACRTPYGDYQLSFADAAVAETEIHQRFADWLEQQIRDHPEQWLWQHRRWKSVPRPVKGIVQELPLHV